MYPLYPESILDVWLHQRRYHNHIFKNTLQVIAANQQLTSNRRYVSFSM